MATFVIQDVGDGNGLDLLDGDWNAVSMALSDDEMEAAIRDREEDLFLLPHTTDDDPPVTADDAVEWLKER